MKVSELLQQRRQNWHELELLCEQVHSRKGSLGPVGLARFASLYRAACADLALADAYQLPPNTVEYLHRLVGRAHNQLYRGRRFNLSSWTHLLLYVAPQRIFSDRCIQLAFCTFWGIFLLSAVLAQSRSVWPRYANQILGTEMIDQLETNFKDPIGGRSSEANFAMAGFYIRHNTGIGLKCFAAGLTVIPGIFIWIYNASVLGASFGYMARDNVPEGANFFHFVTAHGPFELTAIVLAAGSGLRLGISWVYTEGFSRAASLRRTGEYCMPMIGAMMVLFFLAAILEGFLSPSSAPYWIKATVAILCTGALTFYFVILGYPRHESELLQGRVVQFDKTLIAIHERGLLETLDLSLHALRRYAWPLALLFSLGAAPLLLLNYYLVGWILDVDYFDAYFYLEESDAIVRYLWDMTLLVVIEAPLASVFATKFLGDAVFVERPKLSLVVGDVLKLAGRIAWCQLLMRGILAACLLMLALERNGDFNVGIEFFLLGVLAGYSCLMRAFRPFINEIILLEQNPLVSNTERLITINQRSHHLHTPSSGDLFARWLGSAMIAVMLTGTVFGMFLFFSGVFLNDWRPGPFMLLTAFPLSLWIVAGFMTVARFLGYLDLRIRHEGWEVELLLRAEATRMQSHAS